MAVDCLEQQRVTCTAPVNIAVIKYWGKRDEKLVLPTNSSLSVTLSQDQLQTRTTAAASPTFKGFRLWLNGHEEPVASNRRLTVCLEELVRLRRALEKKQRREGEEVKELSTYGLHVCSENNFPTAAGLASSASGFACLIYSVACLFELTLSGFVSLTDLSRIARQGSGSACRSVFGGFVAWNMGEKDDGSDSEAVQVADENHWPELEILVLVASSRKKHTSSTSGMQKSVETSWLLKHRIAEIVPRRMKQMEQAVLDRDFDTFAKLTMADSDNFHAVCADTQPRICYLNDVSEAVMHVVRDFNECGFGVRAAYTFDAGPNPVIYILRQHVPEFLATVLHQFLRNPQTPERQFFSNPYEVAIPEFSKVSEPPNSIRMQGAIERIMHCKVGDGPRNLGSAATVSLLDNSGMPKSLAS